MNGVYDEAPGATQTLTRSAAIAAVKQPTLNTPIIAPDAIVIDQLYHLAMMGDVQAIEDILEELAEQNGQFVSFVAELRKLTAQFQTGKIRQFLKSLEGQA